nr:immunoglobulin light chain junction region [Macaca mulatta]
CSSDVGSNTNYNF